MNTTVVTLKLPTDIYELIRKYCKKIILSTGDTTSNDDTINTDIPTYDDVVKEVNKTGSNINPQRFYQYYQDNNWLDKKGRRFDWKDMLAKWGTYNIEKANANKVKEKAPADFYSNESFKSAVASLMSEAEKGSG